MVRLFFVTAFFFLTISPPVWLTNLENAKEVAKKDHKYILLNFSGSDWCIPCMRLEHDVFNANAFTMYANDNLILVNADFPRKKKNQFSKEQQKLNDALADKYNPLGSFPFTLLLDTDGNKIKIWDGYYKDGAENFINEIKVFTEKN
ncbi:MAG: thioredoxin family protein [Ginsengibacter sp.]